MGWLEDKERKAIENEIYRLECSISVNKDIIREYEYEIKNTECKISQGNLRGSIYCLEQKIRDLESKINRLR